MVKINQQDRPDVTLIAVGRSNGMNYAIAQDSKGNKAFLRKATYFLDKPNNYTLAALPSDYEKFMFIL